MAQPMLERLSAALGIAVARDQLKSDEHVVSIFGDAAPTNGISFEALNNIGHSTKKFIGILTITSGRLPKMWAPSPAI